MESESDQASIKVVEELIPEFAPMKNRVVWQLEHFLIIFLVGLIALSVASFIPLATLRQNRIEFIELIRQKRNECNSLLELNKNLVEKNYECPIESDLTNLNYFDLEKNARDSVTRIDQLKMDIGQDKQNIAERLQKLQQEFNLRNEILEKLGSQQTDLFLPDNRLTFIEQLVTLEKNINIQRKRTLILVRNIESKRLKLAQNLKIIQQLNLSDLEGLDKIPVDRLNTKTEQPLTIQDAQLLADFSSRLSELIPKVESKIYEKTLLDAEVKKLVNSTQLSDNSVELPVLTYHRIEDYEAIENKFKTPARRLLSINPEVLINQLDLIQAKGFETVTLSDLSNALDTQNKEFFKRKIIILSFDDGYLEHYNIVYPELKKRGMKAVFGVITNYLAENSPSSMSWNMVKEMSKNGMEIIPQSVSHCALASLVQLDGRLNPLLGQYRACDVNKTEEINFGQTEKAMMPEEQVKFEIIESRKQIEKNLDVLAPYFVYPYSSYNTQTLDILAANGYELGFTTGNSTKINLDFPLEINRISVPGSSNTEDWGTWLNELKK